jgi:hypothetical protein
MFLDCVILYLVALKYGSAHSCLQKINLNTQHILIALVAGIYIGTGKDKGKRKIKMCARRDQEHLRF